MLNSVVYNVILKV